MFSSVDIMYNDIVNVFIVNPRVHAVRLRGHISALQWFDF